MVSRDGRDDDRGARNAGERRGDRGKGRADPEERGFHVGKLVCTRSEIHHETDHLVPAQGREHGHRIHLHGCQGVDAGDAHRRRRVILGGLSQGSHHAGVRMPIDLGQIVDRPFTMRRI